jgi:predicted enzyme related to lactoylglutathione lyase
LLAQQHLFKPGAPHYADRSATARHAKERAMDHVPGKFVWFEHLSAEPAAARGFYERLFGWHVELMPMGNERYPLIMNGSQGIGGFAGAAPGDMAQWRSYLSVVDVDHAHRIALSAGAKTLLPPTDHGAVGRGATITDPVGATLALWHGSQGDPAELVPTPLGNWCWNELWTSDARRAVAFYEAAFGFTHETMDMGPGGPYHMLSKGSQQRGGVMAHPFPGARTQWVPYVAVADADASVRLAGSLGGRVFVPPSDIPGIGRFAVLADPFGAQFAVIRLQPAG